MHSRIWATLYTFCAASPLKGCCVAMATGGNKRLGGRRGENGEKRRGDKNTPGAVSVSFSEAALVCSQGIGLFRLSRAAEAVAVRISTGSGRGRLAVYLKEACFCSRSRRRSSSSAYVITPDAGA